MQEFLVPENAGQLLLVYMTLEKAQYTFMCAHS